MSINFKTKTVGIPNGPQQLIFFIKAYIICQYVEVYRCNQEKNILRDSTIIHSQENFNSKKQCSINLDTVLNTLYKKHIKILEQPPMFVRKETKSMQTFIS